MKRALTIIALFAFAQAALAGLSGYVTLSGTEYLTSSSSVMYDWDYQYCTSGCQHSMSGWHTLRWSRTGDVITDDVWTVSTGSYRGILNASASPGECYFANNDVIVTLTSGSAAGLPLPTPLRITSGSYPSATVCRPGEPRPPREPITKCDDGSYSGVCSPIVVNLQRGPYRLSDPSDPVEFDIDADGSPNRITWTARGSALAFLALDRNNDGTISNGSELFGAATRLRSGAAAENGFAALQEFDTNGDSLVSVLDDDWSALLLWTDADHDGISQPRELQHIVTSDIQAIETRYLWSGRRDAAGNLFGYKGTVYLDSGRRSIYDVYFRDAP